MPFSPSRAHRLRMPGGAPFSRNAAAHPTPAGKEKPCPQAGNQDFGMDQRTTPLTSTTEEVCTETLLETVVPFFSI